MRTALLTLYVFSPPSVSTPIATWMQRMRTRAGLRELDAHQLADIGRSEEQRQYECAKWFWEA